MAVSNTVKGHDRRDAIIEACTKLIVKHGVGEFTFEAAAKVLKVSRPHIRYYFTSKRDLFLACFEKVAERGQKETLAELNDAHDWKARLLAIINGAFNWYNKSPDDMTILFIFYHYASIEPKLAQVHAQTREVGRKRIESILLTGLSEHMSKADAYEYSVEIQNLLTGLMIDLATTRPDRTAKHLRSAHLAVERIIKRFQA